MKHSNSYTYRLFIQLSVLLTAFLLLIDVLFSKASSFLWVNYYHSPILDTFFTYYTYLGDGSVSLLLVAILFLCKEKMLSVRLLLAFIISGLAVQVVKNLLPAPRPATFFNAGTYHHFITGVTHCGFQSFPSGHTTTAFAIAATLAFHYQRNVFSLVFFMLAATVGWSRVYLGQHFVPDVFGGMVLGIVTAGSIEYLRDVIKIPTFRKQSHVKQHEQPTLEL